MTKRKTNGVGQVGANGTIVHHVMVMSGDDAGRRLTFTQHSPDRYTVFGLSSLPTEGISIERRTRHQGSVLMYDSGMDHALREDEQWLAYCVIANSYYGVLGLGATPEEAYAKASCRFSG